MVLLGKSGPHEPSPRPIPPLKVKNGDLRIDVPVDSDEMKAIGRTHVVVASSEKQIRVVLDDKKEVVVIELEQFGDELRQFVRRSHEGTPATPGEALKLVGPERKDSVAGFACEDYGIQPRYGSRSKAAVCFSEPGAPWFSLPLSGIPGEWSFLAAMMLGGRYAPLRFIGYQKDGSEGGRLEVSKLLQKPLTAQLFELPAGYRRLDAEQAFPELRVIVSRISSALPEATTPDEPPRNVGIAECPRKRAYALLPAELPALDPKPDLLPFLKAGASGAPLRVRLRFSHSRSSR